LRAAQAESGQGGGEPGLHCQPGMEAACTGRGNGRKRLDVHGADSLFTFTLVAVVRTLGGGIELGALGVP
jgi:hypothetical protein